MPYSTQYAEPEVERPDLGLSEDEIQALLKEIRDYREYAEGKWQTTREESRKDRRYLNGDPWDAKDRKLREEAGRPCINHDQLNQYVNEAVNGVRMNPRGIVVEPAGGGSSEQSAEVRQGIIRGIEYQSDAQQAYLNAFQQMVESRYGFFRISREYVSNDPDGPDDQKITINPILNPDSVLWDPDCKKLDGSDARRCMVLDKWQKEDFKARWPWAKVQDYSASDGRITNWVQDKTVVVAEYWKVHVKRVKNARGTRYVDQKLVCKYLTNGLDILEIEKLETADRKPMTENVLIVPMIGPTRYIDEGSGAEATVASLIGLARDPQLSIAFLRSQQLEEAGLAPRIPVVGYEGQFNTETPWDVLNRVPLAYAEVKATTPETEGRIAGALPLPQFQQFTPNTQAYEFAIESCGRAVQSAAAVSALPVAAQRQNEKSGVALERIQQQRQVGSFHFNQIYENALKLAGRIVDSMLPHIYDTPREVAMGMNDDSTEIAQIGPEILQQGDHAIRILAGPSNESQREAATEFLDVLTSNLDKIPPPGSPQAKLLAKAIRMKQLGPTGEEMAEILDPQDQPEIPPQALQAIQMAEQKAAVMEETARKLQAELQEMKQKLDAKVVDNQAKLELEKLRGEIQLALEEMKQSFAAAQQKTGFVQEAARDIGVQLHEQEMSEAQRAHESGEAERGRQHEAQEAEAGRMHESAESAASRESEERRAREVMR